MDSLDYFDWLELVSRTFDMRLLAKAEDNLAIKPRTAIQKYRVQDTEHGPVVMEYNMDQDPRHDAWEPSGDADAIREVLEEHRREMGKPRTAGGPTDEEALEVVRKAFGNPDLEMADCAHCLGEGDCNTCDHEGYRADCPECGGTRVCPGCGGRGFGIWLPWEKVNDHVRKTIKPIPSWAREETDPRGRIDDKKGAIDPSKDSCSACGGTGDCPREQPSGSHYQCDLCHDRNHCAYCGRSPETCNNCGELLRQFNDGHFEHHASWTGFGPGNENLRDDIDPRGPLLIACDKPEPSTHQACKGWGCDECNQSGRTDGDPNGW